ncbi:LEA type 2 family protein [Flavivirga eckloniae]|uniref:LEA type 2 family protein n=1 Tax=Flavivirga eckloniae TaxID=1803846 RepID=UPI001F45568D|nr:LEA type 2 family protein [Flavivirga eckloniae]
MLVKILKSKKIRIRNIIILSTILLAFTGCKVSEKPEFSHIENVKILESTSKHITFTAEAFFKNPNDIGGELKTDEIKVLVNDNEMATVSTKSFKVPAKKEFSIPLKASIPTDRIFSNKNLGGLLGSLLNQKIKVQYKGDIIYKALGFSYTYNIDKIETVKIKL